MLEGLLVLHNNKKYPNIYILSENGAFLRVSQNPIF